MKQILLYISLACLPNNNKSADSKTLDCLTLNYIFSLEIPNVPFEYEGDLITIVDKYHLAFSCDSLKFSKSFNIVASEDSLILKKYYFLDSIIPASDPSGYPPEYRIVYFSNSKNDEQRELIIEIWDDDIGGVGLNYLNADGEYIKKD